MTGDNHVSYLLEADPQRLASFVSRHTPQWVVERHDAAMGENALYCFGNAHTRVHQPIYGFTTKEEDDRQLKKASADPTSSVAKTLSALNPPAKGESSFTQHDCPLGEAALKSGRDEQVSVCPFEWCSCSGLVLALISFCACCNTLSAPNDSAANGASSPRDDH